MAFPEVVSRERWPAARVRLPAEEKEETRRRDALNSKRRMLPMVRIEERYVFDGPEGPATLADLFGNSRQLIVQHVMSDPDWGAACPHCTSSVDELADGPLAHLHARHVISTPAGERRRPPVSSPSAHGSGRGRRTPCNEWGDRS